MNGTPLRELIPAVTAVLVRRGADFATAEDAVQEALIRALALTALEGGRGAGGGEPRREGRMEGESRVAAPVIPQTVFRPLPPGMEPEMAE